MFDMLAPPQTIHEQANTLIKVVLVVLLTILEVLMEAPDPL